MVTLHIEHPITDIETWLGAFRGFAEARNKAGVRSQHIFRPVDDEKYIYIQLAFDTREEAEGFKHFLETRVWASRDASPGLGGAPVARILSEVEQ